MLSSVQASLEQRWEEVLSRVESEVGAPEIDSWFRGARLLELGNDRAILSAPSGLHASRLKNQHGAKLLQALGVSDFEIRIHEVSMEQTLPLEAPPIAKVSKAPASGRATLGAGQDLPLALNPEYSFEHFVVGPCNRFAHAAAIGVADRPATAFNPLFLHGSVGLGKTHLMQAIAHQVLENNPSARVAFLSCEQFVNHFIGSLQQGNLENFRNRYRMADVLIVDDIQLLSNKMRTQEEFFHTFNTLHNAHKQIILTSDAPPEEIPALQERLTSRFKWGLVAEIERPCFETRVAILQAKAQRLGLLLPDEVYRFLAENVVDSVRDLEGGLTRLHAMASLTNRPISLPLAREMMGPSLRNRQRPIRVGDVLKAVTQHFGVSKEDLESKRRTHSIVFPRQVAMNLLRQLTPLSLEEIGRHFGGRDHSTVLYAIEKMNSRRRVDANFAATLAELDREIRQGSGSSFK